MTAAGDDTRRQDPIGDLLRLVNDLLEEGRVETAMLVLDMALLEWQIDRERIERWDTAE